ncbi:hypothetical protein BH11PLA1_BH11PLA1_14730 [soil metagenome]
MPDARSPLTQTEQTLCAAVARRHGALLADLRTHVDTPTGMGHRTGLDATREIFSQRLRALGADATLIRGSPRPRWLDYPRPGRAAALEAIPEHIPPTLICRNIHERDAGLGAVAAPAPAVLLSGHLDTVHDPRGPFNALTIDKAARRATGPGCVDMKGGLVIALHALEALADCGIPSRWAFILNSDEETGSFHSDAALRAEAGSGRYVAGLALEPAMANGALAIARGGSGQFTISTRGKQAHVGRDFASGVSAVTALAQAILGAHHLSHADQGVCVNISPLACDLPPNVVADFAQAWGNVRYPRPEIGEALARDLLALAASGPRDGLPATAIEVVLNRPAKPETPGTRALALAAQHAALDLGQHLPFGTTAGVCDGNNLQAAGLPTIDTLGVRGGGLHTLDEWIDLDSLVERSQLLALLVARICSGSAAAEGAGAPPARA